MDILKLVKYRPYQLHNHKSNQKGQFKLNLVSKEKFKNVFGGPPNSIC
jgi:hypothetical protein